MSDPSGASTSVPPPSLTAIVGALLLAPLLISVPFSLIFDKLGLGVLLVGLPVCLLAIPLVIAIRDRVAFRLRNAVLIGVIMGLALGFAVKIGASQVTNNWSWSGLMVWSVVGIVYSTEAYGLMKAIDKRRDR